MLKNLIAAARTSEFWAGLFVAITEVAPAPIPADLAGDYSTARIVALVYMALRVWSKIIKKIPDPKAPTALAALVLGSALLATPASAQVSMLDVGQRAHVNVNAGSMFLSNGEDWSGASVGAVALYNLHPKLSVAAGYDRGIALNDLDDDLNVFRGWASLPLTPSVYAGFGYVRFDGETEGGFAQIVLHRPVMRRLDFSLVYAHIFPRGSLDDFEQARAVVSYHILGKE